MHLSISGKSMHCESLHLKLDTLELLRIIQYKYAWSRNYQTSRTSQGSKSKMAASQHFRALFRQLGGLEVHDWCTKICTQWRVSYILIPADWHTYDSLGCCKNRQNAQNRIGTTHALPIKTPIVLSRDKQVREIDWFPIPTCTVRVDKWTRTSQTFARARKPVIITGRLRLCTNKS
jgi:hypothetical protein